jgi:hypothetical protein
MDDIVKQLKDSACINDCSCLYCERNKAAAKEIENLRGSLKSAHAVATALAVKIQEIEREAKRRGWDCLEPRRPWDCHKDYK